MKSARNQKKGSAVKKVVTPQMAAKLWISPSASGQALTIAELLDVSDYPVQKLADRYPLPWIFTPLSFSLGSFGGGSVMMKLDI